MVMVTRIFRRNFAAYGRLRQETVRKQAVYCRDRDHRNMVPYTVPRICVVYGHLHAVFSLRTVVYHRPGLR